MTASGPPRGAAGRPPAAAPIAAAAALLFVAACQGGGGFGPDPLEQAVSAYYEAHAIEENRFCLAPLIVGVTDLRPVAEDAAGGRRVVRVRYFYRDLFITGEENSGECTGFATREFTLAADPGAPGGWRVVDMSGPQRGRS